MRQKQPGAWVVRKEFPGLLFQSGIAKYLLQPTQTGEPKWGGGYFLLTD